MTTIGAAREAITQRFEANFTATDRVFYQNEVAKPLATETWSRLVVSNEGTPTAGITLGPVGGRRFTRVARVLIQIWSPIRGGMAAVDALTQTARAVFEGVSFSGLRFFAADVRELETDGKHVGMIVDAPFDYEEQK